MRYKLAAGMKQSTGKEQAIHYFLKKLKSFFLLELRLSMNTIAVGRRPDGEKGYIGTPTLEEKTSKLQSAQKLGAHIKNNWSKQLLKAV